MEEMNVWSLTGEQTANAHDGISDLVNEAYMNADAHGFHDAHRRILGACNDDGCEDMAHRAVNLEMLAKIASEVGEAVSAIQHGDDALMHEELADICIRVFDMVGWLGIDFGSRIIDKMQRNRSRPYLHGKKC